MTTSSRAFPGRNAGYSLLAIGVVFLLADCATTGELAQPPTPPGQAVLVNYGSVMRPRCEDADMKVVNGDKEALGQAYLQAIDGRDVSRLSKETPATPGTHSLSIHCEYSIIGPRDRGIIQREHMLINREIALDQPKRYHLWTDIVDGQCVVKVKDQVPPPPAPLWKAFF